MGELWLQLQAFAPPSELEVERSVPGEVVGTNFERKYIKEGRTFYKLAFRKR